jgi:hypothetical protein
MVATVTVQSETETTHGWSYLVRIERDGDKPTEHLVTLSWADHEHWTGGASPPSRLVEAIARTLMKHEGEGDVPSRLPDRFDASTARRWLADRAREIDDAL